VVSYADIGPRARAPHGNALLGTSRPDKGKCKVNNPRLGQSCLLPLFHRDGTVTNWRYDNGEQIESTHVAFEAGATIAHLHVRKDDGAPSSDPDRFAALQEGLRRHCPGIIVQFSTGGRSGKGSERGGMLVHRPDMASLSTGSCNFPSIVYENHPDRIRELASKMHEYDVKPEIEVFDLSMLHQALRLAVFNVKNAMPAIREVLEFEVTQLKKLMPEAT
jgi:3-keto-5-aminohexanoate cleavage enzyme